MNVDSAEKSGWRYVCRLIELLLRQLSTVAGRQGLWDFLLAPVPPKNNGSAVTVTPRRLRHSGVALLQPLGGSDMDQKEIFNLVQQQSNTLLDGALASHLARLRAALAEDWCSNWRDRRQLRAILFLEVKVEAEPIGYTCRWQPSVTFRIRTRGGSEKLVPAPR